MTGRWLFAADRGGTFTDIVAVDPVGKVVAHKLLSASPAYDNALLAGIRQILQLPAASPLPQERIAAIRIGTTVATNALLERRGTPTALLITAGFGDLLAIGNQARPGLFDLAIEKPGQLYQKVLEVAERVTADGTVLRAPDPAALRAMLAPLPGMGLRSLAVALAHSWINPAHELLVAAVASDLGFDRITLSHECMGLIKLLGRAQTTVVDAYLSPVLARYVETIAAHTGKIPLEFMQSAGGLADAAHFTGKDAILSGPAGGVVALCGLPHSNAAPLMGFDMGGTSTDVSRLAAEPARRFEVTTAGIPYQANMLEIETVAAGGGSVLDFDGRRLTVGPQSAGADPGPACYGRGGPLTITDANLLLGRLSAGHFPRQLGSDGNQGLQLAPVAAGFERLAAEVNRALDRNLSPQELAEGYLRVANEQMAKPIRALSVARGFDVRGHRICCFGGAAGLHACALADLLGVEEIWIHPLAGLFSAWGILTAGQLRVVQRTLLKPFTAEALPELVALGAELAAPAVAELAALSRARGLGGEPGVVLELDFRLRGSDGFITLPATDFATMQQAFAAQYRQRFGIVAAADQMEVATLRARVTLPGWLDNPDGALAGYRGQSTARGTRKVWLAGRWRELPTRGRDSLRPGEVCRGPLLIDADHYSVLVGEAFTARLDPNGLLQLKRTANAPAPGGVARPPETDHARADPVLLEVFNHLFMSIAEQMGAALVNTAHSVNMKERLDFSCALFDHAGNLIANAPHIPVHLGAMGEAVRSLIARRGAALRPGQVYASNHPGHGGSHLPDITVMAPVYAGGPSISHSAPTFFVAVRGHHADIGGQAPGSMSPLATCLAQEGVVLDNLLLVEAGTLREAELLAALTEGPHPARNLAERRSDLLAQLAAVRLGEREVLRLCHAQGLARVLAYMGHIRDYAAWCVRRALEALLGDRPSWRGSCRDALDDGSRVAVALEIDRDAAGAPRLQVDFHGTAGQHPGSFNAPRAVVKAALIYVLRCLVEEEIPLNEGCFAPVTLRIPHPSLLDPAADAAVVAGNVETSQRVVDVLLGALGVAAASQGTMNNLILGFAPDPESPAGQQYYETIGGGAGATAGHDGASAVQVHMTNTRITDPEVLEQRLPGLRLRQFAIRRGSGGAGRWRGGDGIVREFECLREATATLLTQRRLLAPFGMAGGAPAVSGRNLLWRAGHWQELPPVVVLDLAPGDRIKIETPGGGGFGDPAETPGGPTRE